ncbi:hypothetical protein WJX84_001694, partial [Apatococcus fuscideae]
APGGRGGGRGRGRNREGSGGNGLQQTLPTASAQGAVSGNEATRMAQEAVQQAAGLRPRSGNHQAAHRNVQDALDPVRRVKDQVVPGTSEQGAGGDQSQGRHREPRSSKDKPTTAHLPDPPGIAGAASAVGSGPSQPTAPLDVQQTQQARPQRREGETRPREQRPRGDRSSRRESSTQESGGGSLQVAVPAADAKNAGCSTQTPGPNQPEGDGEDLPQRKQSERGGNRRRHRTDKGGPEGTSAAQPPAAMPPPGLASTATGAASSGPQAGVHGSPQSKLISVDQQSRQAAKPQQPNASNGAASGSTQQPRQDSRSGSRDEKRPGGSQGGSSGHHQRAPQGARRDDLPQQGQRGPRSQAPTQRQARPVGDGRPPTAPAGRGPASGNGPPPTGQPNAAAARAPTAGNARPSTGQAPAAGTRAFTAGNGRGRDEQDEGVAGGGERRSGKLNRGRRSRDQPSTGAPEPPPGISAPGGGPVASQSQPGEAAGSQQSAVGAGRGRGRGRGSSGRSERPPGDAPQGQPRPAGDASRLGQAASQRPAEGDENRPPRGRGRGERRGGEGNRRGPQQGQEASTGLPRLSQMVLE